MSVLVFALASHELQEYHSTNVKKLWMLPLLVLVLCSGNASAQVTASPKTVNVRGQIYAPNGATMQGNVRFRLTGEEAGRPPETFDTDSKGAFVLYSLSQNASYTVIVESDGRNFATTTERFYVLGPRPFVTIQLQPLRSAPQTEASVTAAELSQSVPRGARREYESALEQMVAGELDRARKSFQNAIELYPEFVEARSELAVLLMRGGDTAGAEALLRRAVELNNAAARPTLNLGLCLYRQERFAEARPYLERGVQLLPANAQGNLLLGIILVKSGENARAEALLLRAYEQGGKQCARAQYYLSRIYTVQKNYPRAAVALEAYLRDTPDDPNAESLRATLVKLRAAAQP